MARTTLRLDQLLVQRELFPSREQARRAVMAGAVRVEGQVVDKAGTAVGPQADLQVTLDREPYASRAGRKLAAALDHFQLDPAGAVCADIGASTGGFTDCLLQRGAVRVYAIDVGYNQLVHQLRVDSRVVVMERVNARHLTPDALPEACDLMTIDVSFISLLKVAPPLRPHLRCGAHVMALIKPQFEAGREQVGKGGIVRDETVRRSVIETRAAQLQELGFELRGLFDSPVHGVGGNREAFVLLHWSHESWPEDLAQGEQDAGAEIGRAR